MTSLHIWISVPFWPLSSVQFCFTFILIWLLSSSDLSSVFNSDLYPALTSLQSPPPTSIHLQPLSTYDLYLPRTSIRPGPLSTPWPLSDLYPAPTRRRIPAPPCRMPTGRRDWPDSTDRHRYTHNLYCFKIKHSYLHLYCNWMKYISLKWLHCANIVRAFKLVLFYRAKAKVVAAV